MVEPQPSSGSAEDWAWASGGLGDTDAPGLPIDPELAANTVAAIDSSALLAPSTDEQWLGQELRRAERYAVQASRPIAVRLTDTEGQPRGRWFLADILDISRGGLCLLASGPMQLPAEQRLQLDVRSHPDFGLLRLECQVRWCRSSIGFTTMGLAFLEPLPRVPRLELERRTTRRDPNSEPWAQE